ncbi:MAG: hypothetical protein ACYDFT_00370 [Thermoplasmata archaeon]
MKKALADCDSWIAENAKLRAERDELFSEWRDAVLELDARDHVHHWDGPTQNIESWRRWNAIEAEVKRKYPKLAALAALKKEGNGSSPAGNTEPSPGGSP